MSQCPGRYMAEVEVMGFTALLLHRFDLELSTFLEMGFKSKGQAFSKLDETTLSYGDHGTSQEYGCFHRTQASCIITISNTNKRTVSTPQEHFQKVSFPEKQVIYQDVTTATTHRRRKFVAFMSLSIFFRCEYPFPPQRCLIRFYPAHLASSVHVI